MRGVSRRKTNSKDEDARYKGEEREERDADEHNKHKSVHVYKPCCRVKKEII